MGFIFKPELIIKVRDESKIHTRRPQKTGDYLTANGNAVYRNRRLLWQVGKSYAVIPGRGKPAHWRKTDDEGVHVYDGSCFWVNGEQYIGSNPKTSSDWLPKNGFKQDRMVIDSIHAEDVRKISQEDAVKEGFENPLGFLETWVNFYDRLAAFSLSPQDDLYHQWRTKRRQREVADAQSVMDCLTDRPAEKYQA